MNIGNKIKELRTAKLMTQSELAGDEITRNMLSRIENGAALPSLGTITYLAARLGVPAGFLLAEDSDEFAYKKMNSMKNIKRAYTDKNYEFCRDICLSLPGDTDDELELILAHCCLEMADEAINNGKLHRACALLDEAIRHSGKTIYNTDIIISCAAVMFDFMRDISPLLISDESDADLPTELAKSLSRQNRLCRYMLTLEALQSEDTDTAEKYVASEEDNEHSLKDTYILHIKARLKMQGGEYGEALSLLRQITDSDSTPPRFLMYLTCADIEICCRETEDYKGAYEYSGTKMAIAEAMLSE